MQCSSGIGRETIPEKSIAGSVDVGIALCFPINYIINIYIER